MRCLISTGAGVLGDRAPLLLTGTSTWKVKGAKVTAVNAVAAELARGCH